MVLAKAMKTATRKKMAAMKAAMKQAPEKKAAGMKAKKPAPMKRAVMKTGVAPMKAKARATAGASKRRNSSVVAKKVSSSKKRRPSLASKAQSQTKKASSSKKRGSSKKRRSSATTAPTAQKQSAAAALRSNSASLNFREMLHALRQCIVYHPEQRAANAAEYENATAAGLGGRVWFNPGYPGESDSNSFSTAFQEENPDFREHPLAGAWAPQDWARAMQNVDVSDGHRTINDWVVLTRNWGPQSKPEHAGLILPLDMQELFASAPKTTSGDLNDRFHSKLPLRTDRELVLDEEFAGDKEGRMVADYGWYSPPKQFPYEHYDNALLDILNIMTVCFNASNVVLRANWNFIMGDVFPNTVLGDAHNAGVALLSAKRSAGHVFQLREHQVAAIQRKMDFLRGHIEQATSQHMYPIAEWVAFAKLVDAALKRASRD